MKRWTKEEEMIIHENIGTMSVTELAQYFSVSYRNMCEKLQRMKLKSKEQRQILWSTEEEDILLQHYAYAPKDYILEKLPHRQWHSIQAHALRKGIQKISQDRTYVNYQFFDKWTEESSYVIGFMLADGYIRLGDREYFQIETQSKDIDVLQKMVTAMNLRKRLYQHSKGKDSYKITCANKWMIRQLIEKGVTPYDKSHSATFPNNVPDNMYRHLIRGLVDGDGWVSYRLDTRNHLNCFWGLCGTLSVVQGALQHIPIPIDNKVQLHNNCYRIGLQGIKAFQVAEWLYQDSSIYMERKYQAYQEAKQKYAPSSE